MSNLVPSDAWASAQADQESSLYAEWIAKDPNCLHADSENSDQTESLPGTHAILLVLPWGGSNKENITYLLTELIINIWT